MVDVLHKHENVHIIVGDERQRDHMTHSIMKSSTLRLETWGIRFSELNMLILVF